MSALVQEDEVLEEISQSKREAILERLRSKNLLGYGTYIRISDMEYVLDTNRRSVDAKDWAFLDLQLREIVKGQGFFITSRGKEGNLYILQQTEMAAYNESKNKNAYNNLKQRQRALHMIDPNTLTAEQAKKLEFEILKNASMEIEMQQKLFKRCRY